MALQPRPPTIKSPLGIRHPVCWNLTMQQSDHQTPLGWVAGALRAPRGHCLQRVHLAVRRLPPRHFYQVFVVGERAHLRPPREVGEGSESRCGPSVVPVHVQVVPNERNGWQLRGPVRRRQPQRQIELILGARGKTAQRTVSPLARWASSVTGLASKSGVSLMKLPLVAARTVRWRAEVMAPAFPRGNGRAPTPAPSLRW